MKKYFCGNVTTLHRKKVGRQKFRLTGNASFWQNATTHAVIYISKHFSQNMDAIFQRIRLLFSLKKLEKKSPFLGCCTHNWLWQIAQTIQQSWKWTFCVWVLWNTHFNFLDSWRQRLRQKSKLISIYLDGINWN